MSSAIDWSKAPEGATHYSPARPGFYACYWRLNRDGLGKEIWVIRGNDVDHYRDPFVRPKNREEMIARPATSWNGEGLPPVGTVCEYYWGNSRWKECKVFAHKPNDNHGTDVLVDLDGDWSFSAKPEKFRPIKTAEQIAAEERKRAISAMAKDIGSVRAEALAYVIADSLYDMGYRKQEES